MNIVLVGMKHCGKSTQGRLLAEKLNWRFADSDEEIERLHGEGLACREIYKKIGADGFRQLEAQAVMELLNTDGPDRVCALGGGAVSNPFMPEQWLLNAIVVYLKASPLVMYSRVAAGGLPPFLAEADDPAKAFEKLCAEREPAFEAVADCVFNLDMQASAEDNSAALFNFLKEKIDHGRQHNRQ
ncbi:MAG: shikimate kinase [Victivallaceae bacterium]|nr:shikimate kinase [Victivallaceae bacterium]